MSPYINQNDCRKIETNYAPPKPDSKPLSIDKYMEN